MQTLTELLNDADRLLHEPPFRDTDRQEPSPFPGAIVARVGNSDQLLYLRPEMVIGNDDVASASVSSSGDRFDVAIQLVPSAAERMRQATAAHSGGGSPRGRDPLISSRTSVRAFAF